MKENREFDMIENANDNEVEHLAEIPVLTKKEKERMLKMSKNKLNKMNREMLKGIDDKFIFEATQENAVPRKKGKSRKNAAIGLIAASLCLFSGTIYLTGMPNRNKEQLGVCISYNGVNMYYEQEELIRIKTFILKNKKGEKIDEFGDETVTWYKLKDSNNIKTIICDDGNDVTEWKFVSYSFDEGDDKNVSWIVENVFSISSKEDIKNITINGEVCELNNSQKEKLYNKLLALKYPKSDKELSLMEEMSVNYSELIKMNINTENGTLNFVIDPSSKVLKLDEDVYSLFSVMTDDELSNIW